MYGLINVGFGNVIIGDRVIAIVNPESAPLKRLKEVAKEEGKLIDATYGRKTRAIVITDSNHVILSAIQPETIASRFMQTFTDIEKLLEEIRQAERRTEE
ncbi:MULTISPECIES: DUF370 domain-containing protein [Kosmotoga]|uniref:Putative regulatory protein Kole_1849 n=2 Tax=Kosmotogaceae TaxID=1643948 RepID=Y1849_KOSOT|nr:MULTISPECIES: DUF370 domain-containing protein [Kosmotoga]C5CGF0.1 RecName: Full=Putative regulatory protein Kole_1849 [Kosmotoga olearia TBF 19.5.1]ACR80531.1 protein of unknown function DUF370 [Kosmotoga olearia TBF 19.5.1]MDI3523338.1 extracellular matrix regulatory protein [Kosmotoga sp.]MDK2953560.1 extracellular matrix regulatory protein [Kosmotoga sp.]OAA19400.1 hypothetical protein DU53_10115 [Kosmotoga sp. DU53]